MSTALTAGRPVWEIEVLAMDVAFEVRVNDQPVLRMPVSRVQTAFDVNPHVQSGENTLSLTVRPRTRGRGFSEHAACKVALRWRSAPEADSTEPIGTLVFSGYGADAVTGFGQSTAAAGGGPIEVERFGAKATMVFLADAPFGEWGWQSAEELTATEQLRAEVLAEFRRVHGLLERKDAATLAARCALQATDFQRAYYLPRLEDAHGLLGIAQVLSDGAVEVEPFPDSILTLELLGQRRLVHLVDDEGKSPLKLRSTEVQGMVGRFNCVLCRTAQGWQIAR